MCPKVMPCHVLLGALSTGLTALIAGADLLWTTAATRVAVPTDGTPVLLYSDDQVTKPNAALELATYFGWYVSSGCSSGWARALHYW